MGLSFQMVRCESVHNGKIQFLFKFKFVVRKKLRVKYLAGRNATKWAIGDDQTGRIVRPTGRRNATNRAGARTRPSKMRPNGRIGSEILLK